MVANASFAETDERTMAFSVSPIALLRGGIDVMFQIKLTDYLSLTVPANFYYSWLKANTVKWLASQSKYFKEGKSPLDGQIGVGARFLMAKQGLSDTFYVEPRISLGYEQFGVAIDNEKFESESMMLSPMLHFGWDWYYDSGFYASLGAGLGAHVYFNNKTTVPKHLKDNLFVNLFFPPQDRKYGLAIEGDFKLGFAF